jgi:ribosomal protein S18 acetylase RimI-like enzyme
MSRKADFDCTSIRRCKPGDEHALSLVSQATFLESFAGDIDCNDILEHCEKSFTHDSYLRLLNSPYHAMYLVELNSTRTPIGYTVIEPSTLDVPDASASDLHLKRLYLFSKYHGYGIGKRIIFAAIEYAKSRNAKRLLVTVYTRNNQALAFYDRVGFRKVGAARILVGNTEYDAIIMAFFM